MADIKVGDRVKVARIGRQDNEETRRLVDNGTVGTVVALGGSGRDAYASIEFPEPDRRRDIYLEVLEVVINDGFKVGDKVKVKADADGEGRQVRESEGTIVSISGDYAHCNFPARDDYRKAWNVEFRNLVKVEDVEAQLAKVRSYLISLAGDKGWCRTGVNGHFAAMGLKPWVAETKFTIEVTVEGHDDLAFRYVEEALKGTTVASSCSISEVKQTS